MDTVMDINTETDFERALREGASQDVLQPSQVQPQEQLQEQPQEQLQEQPQTLKQATPKSPEEPKEKKGFISKTASAVTELAMAPLRGLEGAAEGLYGFFDAVSQDRLWDWDRDQHTLFGRNKTTVGRLAEGLVQFGVGFVPGLGAASLLGKVSKVTKLTGALSKSKNAFKTFATGRLSLSANTMKKMSKLKSATKANVRLATAGWLSDYFAFKGEEEALSTMLARYDTDQSNDLIQWLAYNPDKDETELDRRWRNSLEGLVVGEAVGLAFVGLRGAYKGLKGFPEKDPAVSGLTKTFNKLRNKNKIVTESRISGKELDEVDAIDKALSNPENQLTPNEIKAGRELNKRIHDRNKSIEYEESTGTKLDELDRSPDVAEAERTVSESKAPTVKSIDPDSATEEQLDSWLRENANITGANSSLETKRGMVNDILNESKEGGTEHLIKRLEDNVINIVKKAGLYDETNPQAMLSGIRLVRSVPEMRALLSRVSQVALKASREAKKGDFSPKDAEKFYNETNEILGLGVEGAGGKASKIYLDQFRGRIEDLKVVRAEADTLYDAMNASARDIKTAMNNAMEAMERTTVEVSFGKEVKVLNSDQAMTELYSAMDRFGALQEIWADFGTQLSLGMRQRQDLYKTGQSSLGRDISGQHKTLGMAVEDAVGEAGKRYRRQSAKAGVNDKRVVKDLQKIFKKSGTSEVDVGDLVRDMNSVGINNRLARYNLVGRKGLAVSQEWYYNAILGNPVSWIVNMLGGALVQPLRHIEQIGGGLASGNIDLVRANFRVMFDIQSFADSLKYALRSGYDDEARSIAGYTAFRDDRIHKEQGEIHIDNPDGNVVYSAINFIGKVVRHPTRVMMAGDEFFKQMSYRSRIKTALAVEGYQKGIHREPGSFAEYINDGFEGMITKDGRFRNEENVKREAILALSKARKAGELEAADERAFVDDYMQKHYRDNNLTLEDGIIYNQKGFDERELLMEAGKDWALMNTFTNEVTNPFFKKTGEVATMSPWLGFIIPFVRTPSNIILFALGRSLPNPIGGASELMRLSKRAKDLKSVSLDDMAKKYGDTPESRRLAESYLQTLKNETGVKKAELIGRLSTGAMTMSALFMNIERIGENITGSSPKDPGKRAAWEATGKKAFSIKVGDTWYNYQRFDPFATILGIMADISQGFTDMRDTGVSEFGGEEEFIEHQNAFSQVSGILAMSLANNVSNKSYLKNLGELLDILEKPTERVTTIMGNISAGFVPNGINWTQNVYQEDAPILEARSIVDKIMKRLPEPMRVAGQKLMPRRNFLGEIQRKETTGNVIKGLTPVFWSTTSNDIVDMEIEHQAVGRNTMSDGRNIGGKLINYRDYRNKSGQTAYDRMQELSGTIKLGSRRLTLRQSLRRLIESNDYQRLPPITENNKHKDHPRSKELTKVINIYRAEARRQTENEFQELKSNLFELLK